MADRSSFTSLFAVLLLAVTAGCATGSQRGGKDAALLPTEAEQRLIAQCDDRNYTWMTRPDGSRSQVGQALTDAARYVWQNGQCEVIGGLYPPPPPPPPTKPNP